MDDLFYFSVVVNVIQLFIVFNLSNEVEYLRDWIRKEGYDEEDYD